MKSAIEIALEKTRDIAPEAGFKMPAKGKEEIRTINQDFDSKIAELEIKVSGELRRIAQEYGAEEARNYATELSGRLRAEKDRINAERREQTDAVNLKYEKKLMMPEKPAFIEE